MGGDGQGQARCPAGLLAEGHGCARPVARDGPPVACPPAIAPALVPRGGTASAHGWISAVDRGIGMFVAAGARATLLARRRAEFTDRYVEPLLTEATRLGIDADELIGLIKEVGNEREGASL